MTLEEEVAAIGGLSREDLASRWLKTYGCPPPKGIKRGLLERSAAWNLQAKRFGGLSASAKRVLRAAQRAEVDRAVHIHAAGSNVDAPAAHEASAAAAAARMKARTGKTPHQPRPGMRFVREWNGRTHVVEVTEAGFLFDGKTYRSLGAVARRITGAHWSGPRFFTP